MAAGTARRRIGHLKVFLSHSNADADEVARYKSLLLEDGFDPWAYEKNLDYGESIPAQVRKHIEDCDFFFLMVSDASLASSWVPRELGYALKLQRERRERQGIATLVYRPIIVPVFLANASWRQTGAAKPETFPVLDIDTMADLGAFKFDVRCHDPVANPHTDTDEWLLQSLRPALVMAGRDPVSEDQMRDTQVFELYEALFPPEEQDSPDKIIKWTLERDDGNPRRWVVPRDEYDKRWLRPGYTKFTYHLDSWYPILTLRGRAIALAFLTVHPASKLVFGNYIAVQECWRGSSIADALWNALKDELVLNPETAKGAYLDCRGMLFEVETFDVEAIKRIVSELEGGKPVESLAEHVDADGVSDLDSIRRFLRLCWYNRKGVTFYHSGDAPLLYRSPCLEPDEHPRDKWADEEPEYWVGWYRNPNIRKRDVPNPTWAEVVQFIMIDVLANSIAVEYPDYANRYLDYAHALRKRVAARALGGKCTQGRLFPGRQLETLLRRWRNLKLQVAI